MLLIAGEKDQIAPVSVVKANFRLYRKSSAVTDYRQFANRSHYIFGQDGWEEVADATLDWAASMARRAVPAF